MKHLGLCALLLLSACSTVKPVPAPTEVAYIPVPVSCPVPVLPARPTLQTPQLPEKAPTNDLLRALAGDYTALIGYSKELETILSGYKK
jgi:hypothetical protein